MKLQIGTTCWVLSIDWTGDTTNCPVCHGTTMLEVKPKGSIYPGQLVKCDYCSRGRDVPPGKVTDTWSYKTSARLVTITGEKIETGCPTEYRAALDKNDISPGAYMIVRPDQAFETEAEAFAAGKPATEAVIARRAAEKDAILTHELSKTGWRLGYHLEHLGRLRREAKYHLEHLLRFTEEELTHFIPVVPSEAARAYEIRLASDRQAALNAKAEAKMAAIARKAARAAKK